MPGQTSALDFDCDFPAFGPALRLEAPFKHVPEQHGEAADQFALLGPAHALDFLGDVFDISFLQLSGAQQLGLLIRPSVKILVVESGIAHPVVSGHSLAMSAE